MEESVIDLYYDHDDIKSSKERNKQKNKKYVITDGDEIFN